MQSWLLADQTFRSSRQPRNLDFQARFPALSPQPQGSPVIVALTRSFDAETDAISLRLASEGVCLIRLNCDNPPSTLKYDVQDNVLTVDGRSGRPTHVWTRYWNVDAVPTTGDAAEDSFRREQWRAFAVLLAGVLQPISWPRNPAMLTRTGQCALVARHGFRVAARVVTTNPHRAVEDYRHAVHKSLGRHMQELSPCAWSGLFPLLRNADSATATAPDESAPTLVEEYVEHTREIRVFQVGNQKPVTFAASGPDHNSLFNEPESVSIEPVETPTAVHRVLGILSREFELPLLACDFLIQDDETSVFLEANLEGDWLPYEQLSGTDFFTEAMVAQLVTWLRAKASG